MACLYGLVLLELQVHYMSMCSSQISLRLVPQCPVVIAMKWYLKRPLEMLEPLAGEKCKIDTATLSTIFKNLPHPC